MDIPTKENKEAEIEEEKKGAKKTGICGR